MRKWRILLLLLGLSASALASGGGPFSRPESSHVSSKFYDLSSYCSFSDSTENKIHSYFLKHYKSGIFNGTYLFFSNDSLTQGALGWANFSKRDTLINDDLFQLASVSKTITGVAVLLLHQDGLLNVDDSVHWYLPDLTRRNLTIRNLLCHMSGLPDYFYFSGTDNSKHMVNHDVVNQLNQQPLNTFGIPGTYHQYSNTNYALLAHIVERVSGMDFRRFTQKYIFEPSGMKYTHICNFDSIPMADYAVQGYENRHLYGDIPHNGTNGDKGVYANTVEMFFLDRALRTSFVLHKGTRDLMWTPQVATTADGAFYGLGWRIKWIDGRKWVFHNGWWKGYRTYYWRCLEEDKCFVVLTNNVYGPFLRTSELVDLLR
ncbi:MAG: beta-lactamase family protein [Bacteroidetes bacterium]|nr:beta-lactamase family protein [Bacteroidota bacterium]